MSDPSLTHLLVINFVILLVSLLIVGLVELFWPGLLPESFKKPISIIINVCTLMTREKKRKKERDREKYS